MDPDDILSQFAIDRLDGDPVPDDLQILLPHRDELALRSGFVLMLDENESPRLAADDLAVAVRSDPDAAADLRARAEVCRLCAFVAHDTDRGYLGYWRGPSHRKAGASPLVALDDSGPFHLCAAQTFAEAVLERNYGRKSFPELKDWLESLGISIGWENPSQLTLPHERFPPRDLYRELYDRYRRSLRTP